MIQRTPPPQVSGNSSTAPARKIETATPPATTQPKSTEPEFKATSETGEAASTQHLQGLNSTFGTKSELKLGSRGPEVKKLQEMLNKKTGGKLKVDGIFGPKTQKAFDEAKKLDDSKPGATDPAQGGANTPSGTTPQNNPAETQPAGQQAPGSGNLEKGAKGRVNQNDLSAYLEQRIASSGLNGFKPQDGDTYGVDGSAKSWASFMTKLVGKESNFNSNDVSEPDAFRGGSRGLFQLSMDDAKNYGLNGGKSFSAEQLADPKANADAAVTIMERLVKKSGTIRGGAGKYWGPIKRGWNGQ